MKQFFTNQAKKAGGAAFGCGYGGYRLFKLKQKISFTSPGEETHFTETDAKIVEKLIKRIDKKSDPENGEKQ